MSDWETYGYRVTWLESLAFAGREPTRHEAEKADDTQPCPCNRKADQ